MLTEKAVRDATGYSPSQLERLAADHFITRRQKGSISQTGRRGRPMKSGKRGTHTNYDNDTIDRINKAIKPCRLAGQPKTIVATELLLQWYDLPGHWVKVVLREYLNRSLQTSFQPNRRLTVDAAPPTRQQDTRNVNARLDAINQTLVDNGIDFQVGEKALDAGLVVMQGSHGNLPKMMTFATPEPVSALVYTCGMDAQDPDASTIYSRDSRPNRSKLWDFYRLRDEVLPVTSEARLEQATGWARDTLAEKADDYVARVWLAKGHDLEDFVKRQLPGHPVKIKHTAKQVMLPFMVQSIIDPLATADAVANANDLFEISLEPGIGEVVQASKYV